MSQALLLGASEQLRITASMGGTLCQRVRCAYHDLADAGALSADP
jgi:xanthine dehydrogenase YagS FAD-binding subunit